MQSLISQGQAMRTLSSEKPTIVADPSKPSEVHNALVQARTTIPQKTQADSNDAVPFAKKLIKEGFFVDSELKHVMRLIKKLDQSQAAQKFDGEKIITLRTLLDEIEYEDSMDAMGYPVSYFETDEALERSSATLPTVLQPSFGLSVSEDSERIKIRSLKIVVHDDVAMIIGFSRKSSFPSSVEYQNAVTVYRERARKFVQFYLDRCHVGRDHHCCTPRRETVVIFGSSNTDFDNSRLNGIQSFRLLLEQLTPGEKVVLTSSQTDGICTNMLGFDAFIKPFLSKGIDIDLMVWWSNETFYLYNVRTLLDQLYAKIFGGPLDPYYQDFLSSMAGVAGNKNVMAAAQRANKQAEGLGLRNARYIDAEDYEADANEEVVVSHKARASMPRDTTRSVKEVVLSKSGDGLFISPTIDGITFATSDEVIRHVTNLIMDKPQNERECLFCSNTFYSYVRSGPIINHIRRHIFEQHICQCGYSAKTAADLAAHQARHTGEGKSECPHCHNFFEKYRLSAHIREAHVRSEQVTLFGDIMGIRQWTLQ
jgi:hypothetical protein